MVALSVAAKGLYDLYVTTYETVKSEEEFFVEQIPHWQCIVLGRLYRSIGIRQTKSTVLETREWEPVVFVLQQCLVLLVANRSHCL